MKKTAIITGASRGIGYAAAKKLGMDGCQVVLFATGEKERYKSSNRRINTGRDHLALCKRIIGL